MSDLSPLGRQPDTDTEGCEPCPGRYLGPQPDTKTEGYVTCHLP